MRVNELIMELEKVADKSREVYFVDEVALRTINSVKVDIDATLC